MAKNKKVIQLIWGIALVLAGIGVFYRIPQVMPKIEQIKQFSSIMFFIRFCFYFLGVLLIGGGVKKLYNNYKNQKDSDEKSFPNT
ncbi:MAG: hypothetical protein L6247_00820 [Desulfobacteraceae bacterium]|nr:hypothetical protein [Pseudomonadota bacterium]MCG2754109.1 hypothetical protein [Desulfobacteraceae bacterium]